MLTILRRWLSPRRRVTAPRRRGALRLSLEHLEDRCTPAVLTVNSVADNTAADGVLTLREAVQLVDGTLGRTLSNAEKAQVTGTLGTGDTIQFNLPSGSQTITLTGGPLSVTAPVAVNGPGAGTLTVNGNGAGRVFFVGPSFTQDLGLAVSLSGLTIAGGQDAYGAGLFNAVTLTLSNVAFAGNTATANGGGGVYNNGALSLSGCAFSNNTTLSNGTGATSGGALLNTAAGTVKASGCTFTGNTAPGTGATAGQGGALSNSGTMTVDGSTISNNSAAFGGGGVYNGSGSLTLTSCTVSGNTVTPNAVTAPEGGGLLNGSAGTVTLTNCTFSGNSAQGSGATAGQGGGVYNSGGTLTVNGGTFTSNAAASDGGGIYTLNTGASNPVVINNATFSGNNSAADGGGIRAHLNSIVTVTGCTFVGNNASSEGGAIDGSLAAKLTILNSTFTGNNAGSIGGALNCGGLGTVTFTNDTITGNTVGATFGGGINIRSPGVTLQNTIVAGNFGSGTTPNDITGYDFTSTPQLADPSSSYNLIGPGGSGGLVNGVNHNQVGVTSLGLGPLAGNGGPTQTMALLPGSPAIDRGSNAFVTPGETDQRQLPRIVNGTVDIGAFEAQPPPGPVLLVNSTADNTTADSVLTLREAIALVDGTLGRSLTAGEQAQITGTLGPDDTIEFNLPAGPQTITLTGGALSITRPVAILGPGAALLTVNGNNADRVFVVGQDGSPNLNLSVSISGLTISGGRAAVSGKDHGGGLLNFGTLALGNVAFTGNTASSGGGGALYNGGAATVNGCTFSTNAATNGGPGGAVRNTSSATLSVTGCVFTGNTATGGGSGGGIANAGTLTASGSNFAGNRADANGGGIDNGGAAVVTASTLSGNFAVSQGGGLANRGNLTLINVTLSGNTAGALGGGLSTSGPATLTSCTLTGNRVTQGSGGGLYSTSTTRLVNTVVSGNFRGPAPGTTADNIAGTVVVTGPSTARGIIARLVTVKVGKKKRLFVVVLFADTGARKNVFLSPFQRPWATNIQVKVLDTNRDGVADTVAVTARRGGRRVAAVFPA